MEKSQLSNVDMILVMIVKLEVRILESKTEMLDNLGSTQSFAKSVCSGGQLTNQIPLQLI